MDRINGPPLLLKPPLSCYRATELQSVVAPIQTVEITWSQVHSSFHHLVPVSSYHLERYHRLEPCSAQSTIGRSLFSTEHHRPEPCSAQNTIGRSLVQHREHYRPEPSSTQNTIGRSLVQHREYYSPEPCSAQRTL